MNEGGQIIRTVFGTSHKEAETITLRATKEILEFTSPDEVRFHGKVGGKKFFDFKNKKEDKPLKVTKVEGPYDENGKKVSVVKKGEYYIYKATPSYKPSNAEVKQMKWAIKYDNGDIKEFAGFSAYNKLIDGKICVNIQSNHDFEKAKIYAFYQKPDDKSSVEIGLKKSKFPMLILQSATRKGLTKELIPAKDILYSDYPNNEVGYAKFKEELKKESIARQLKNKKDDIIPLIKPTDEQINNIAENIASNKVNKLKSFCKKPDSELFDDFKNGIDDFALGKLDDVSVEMVNKMQRNEGGEYSNIDLTNEAKNHSSSIAFINGVEQYIKDYLKKNKGEIEELEVTDPKAENDPKAKGQVLYKILVKDDKELKISRPILGDWLSGLGITINQVHAYQLYVTNYKLSGNQYELTLNYIYWDHFGLDTPDLEKHDQGVFYAWFVLQHFKGYKPFLTKVSFERKIKGSL